MKGRVGPTVLTSDITGWGCRPHFFVSRPKLKPMRSGLVPLKNNLSLDAYGQRIHSTPASLVGVAAMYP